MKIRYIQSMAGRDTSYQANEKDKSGRFVWYDTDDLTAVRLIDAEIAVAQSEEDYKKAKANQQSMQEKADKRAEIAQTLSNLDGLKAELEADKVTYKELGAKIKDIDAKIKEAEATIKPAE